jgi:hypothetical protein
MAISVHVRGDDAIVIYDEDDPRSGVVIEKPKDVAKLIVALNVTMAGLCGEEGWGWARKRALIEAVADETRHLN